MSTTILQHYSDAISMVPPQWKTTPALLRIMMAGIWILCAIFMIAGLVGIERHRHSMQTIGKDSAPSIIAAEHIRTCLADMHTQVALMWLTTGDAAQKAAANYDLRRVDAADQMVTAAENITYGDAERKPIRALVTGLATYEAEVAQARLLKSAGSADFAGHFHEADRLLHAELLPASDALDDANFAALNAGYDDERGSADWATTWMIVAALVLMGGLVAAQWFLFLWTRRVFNPLLVGATLLACCLLVILFAGYQREREQLRIAKIDCFDSLYALWHARACAYDANAAMLCDLIDPGISRDRFASNTSKLASAFSSQSLVAIAANAGGENPTPDELKGYLADELRNITFDGEREAATDSLKGFVAYLQICNDVTTQSAAHDTSTAIDTAVNKALPAFNHFDDALGRTLYINQQAFDTAVPAGFEALDGLTGETAGIVMVIAAMVFAGFRPRIKEYASR